MQVNDGRTEKNVSSAASVYFKSLSLHLNGIKNTDSRHELLLGMYQWRPSSVLIRRKITTESISLGIIYVDVVQLDQINKTGNMYSS